MLAVTANHKSQITISSSTGEATGEVNRKSNRDFNQFKILFVKMIKIIIGG